MVLFYCVDFRELNKRTAPDRHPLPRVQTTIENLGGNEWFSLLDQGKAYQQGFISPDCQHMTAYLLSSLLHLPTDQQKHCKQLPEKETSLGTPQILLLPPCWIL